MNDQSEIETGTALVVAKGASLVSYFTEDKIDPLISQIEEEVRSHAPDLSTTKGRKAVASLAFKVSQTKTALDKAGKAMNDDKRAEINAVDAQRRVVRERLDALRDEARKPLDEWEAAEEDRKAELSRRIDQLDMLAGHSSSSAEIKAEIDRITSIPVNDTWAEREEEAIAKKQGNLTALSSALDAAVEREEQAEELARLRAAEDERIRKEREEQAAREKVEAERLAAERAEHERRQREKAAAEESARIEREKAEAAERAAQEEREAANRRQREAEERHKRELAEAKAREQAAAQAERSRIAAEQAAADEARAKRERDEAHKARILSEISAALQPIPREQIAQALLDGRVPHVAVAL